MENEEGKMEKYLPYVIHDIFELGALAHKSKLPESCSLNAA